MKRTVAVIAGVLLALAPLSYAAGGHPPRIRLGWFSQQDGRSHAGAGARIDVQETKPAHHRHSSDPTAHIAVHTGSGSSSSKVVGGATDTPPAQPIYPSLPASSPLLKRAQPFGPGSFWYQDGSGHVCPYVPDSSGLCFTITGGADPGETAPPLTPTTIAEHVADRIALSPGQVEASPLQAGLTGAASWVWLDPAPTTKQLSISLAGEAVTVTAVPSISWDFGDGSSLGGGAGVPYRAGPTPSAAITHVYKTRCLPGDQGHDPYVLASCGSHGYQLAATVSWQISYRASGTVAATGTLPTRTTTSATSYPVSEARAFLVQGTDR